MPITINAENIHDAAEKLGLREPRSDIKISWRRSEKHFDYQTVHELGCIVEGGRLKPRGGRQNGERNNYQDFCSLALGMRYPLPEFGEQIMGYRLGWTFAETWRSETQSSRTSQPKSGERSSKQKACDDKKRKRPYFHTGNH